MYTRDTSASTVPLSASSCTTANYCQNMSFNTPTQVNQTNTASHTSTPRKELIRPYNRTYIAHRRRAESDHRQSVVYHHNSVVLNCMHSSGIGQPTKHTSTLARQCHAATTRRTHVGGKEVFHSTAPSVTLTPNTVSSKSTTITPVHTEQNHHSRF